jgi:hypothetical protein
MEAIINATDVADDPLLRVANTWADHFKFTELTKRNEFIKNYVYRCREHRFWTASAVIDGITYTICRLADYIHFYDGKKVQIKVVNYQSDKRYGTWRHLTKAATLKLPYLSPNASQIKALVKSYKRSFSEISNYGTANTANTFDSMTTFSKAYRMLVDDELRRDLKGHSGLNDKSSDARYIHPRRRYYNGIGASAIKGFVDKLNPDIVKAIRSVGCPSYSLYNWIAAGNIERRIQAVRSFPLMVPYILLSHAHGHIDDLYRKEYDEDLGAKENYSDCLGRQVDDGQRIQPILATVFNCSEKIIKAVNTFRLHHTGSALNLIGRQGWGEKLRCVFSAAGLGNRLPQNKAEWRIWIKFLNTLPYDLLNCIPQKAMATFLTGCPAWSAPEWNELLGKACSLRDMNLHFHALGTNATAPISRLQNMTFKQLLNLSEQWHTVRDQVVRELSKDDELNATQEDNAWPALLSQPVTHPTTSIEIVELTVPGDLFLEGKTMRHCVDGYGDACYSGKSRIFSLRLQGKSLATAELKLTPWKKNPSVANLYLSQISGVQNAFVTEKSDEGKAFNWFFRQIRSRAIEVNVNWPNMSYSMRPVRMRNRDTQVKRIMRDWLSTKLGNSLTTAPEAELAIEVF